MLHTTSIKSLHDIQNPNITFEKNFIKEWKYYPLFDQRLATSIVEEVCRKKAVSLTFLTVP